MTTKFFKDFWWFLSEGWVRSIARWAEGVSARNNAYRPVSKIKNTPVSGDALAPYSREWRKFIEDSNL